MIKPVLGFLGVLHLGMLEAEGSAGFGVHILGESTYHHCAATNTTVSK